VSRTTGQLYGLEFKTVSSTAFSVDILLIIFAEPGKPYDLDLRPFSSTELKLTWTKPKETCAAKYTIKVTKHTSHGDTVLEERPNFKIVGTYKMYATPENLVRCCNYLQGMEYVYQTFSTYR
jgi:hypothetical protein